MQAPITTTRPMTEAERNTLRAGLRRRFEWRTGIVSSMCVFVLVFLVTILATLSLPYGTIVRTSVVTAAVASVAWYLRVQRRLRSNHRALTDRIDGELATGTLTSTTYTIRDVVAVEEAEDEGLSYYLLLDDGRTLFLSGQYLYEPALAGFPWESFEIVRVTSGGRVLDVLPRGPSIRPSAIRPPFSAAEYTSGKLAQDGTIETIDFRSVRTAL
jgi:hypothetical protein